MKWLLSLANIAHAEYMPIQASTFASDFDAVYNFVLWASIISFVILIGGLTFFVYKYQRKSDNDKTAYITHNHVLEFLWSFIPLVIFMGIFYWGWIVYKEMRTVPENALSINVLGQKWSWEMTYPNGRKVAGDNFVVPAGRPVVLNLTSKDVIHSFYVPSFRIKQDVVPGYRSKVWFQSDRVGEYNLFCAEYCGTQHSKMLGIVKVIPAGEFDKWVEEDSAAGMSPVQKGEQLYKLKACIGCHSTDGSRLVGPTFKGLYGNTQKFSDGSSLVTEDDYIRESILKPQAKIVEGYPENQMPVYQGQLSEEEINQLIEFIKTLQ